MQSRSLQLLLLACFWSLGLSQTLDGEDYCYLYLGVYTHCALQTSDFFALPETEKASCLCGSTISNLPWGPSSFDDAVVSCASYEATYYPPIVSVLTPIENFCVNYGPSAPGSNPPSSQLLPTTTTSIPVNLPLASTTPPSPSTTITPPPANTTPSPSSVVTASTSTKNGSGRLSVFANSVIHSTLIFASLWYTGWW